MKKLISFLVIGLFVATIVACSSPEESAYQIMEDAASKEADFEKQQEPMNKLESNEKALFDQIMELGMKEFEQIQKLADKALTNLDEREKLMKKEKEALEKSKEEFQKAKAELDKINDEKLKKEAQQLEDIMNDRFNAYDALHSAYLKGLSEDRKIYELVKDEELSMDSLQEQVEASNKAYEEVKEANGTFNEKTEEFNKKKLEFYKKAGFKITSDNKE
ncbi:YkyA family protein [Lederbergia sp. NSJ-179]|uniref:YkyA family protein n=1 Tax=Lederbergia sp. NSJ-179 TaxID=2931402 RepID=UPI001FCFF109|nr:YkyA family protein [Lederbergia sp. NSJ-179]MCJ7841684.1 YkyA family protein [Lederbergia sp. NSJ-179]